MKQVWSADITYAPLLAGFGYLVAIIDWYSRYVFSWEVPTTMESEFCVSALNQSPQVAIAWILQLEVVSDLLKRHKVTVPNLAKDRLTKK